MGYFICDCPDPSGGGQAKGESHSPDPVAGGPLLPTDLFPMACDVNVWLAAEAKAGGGLVLATADKGLAVLATQWLSSIVSRYSLPHRLPDPAGLLLRAKTMIW